MATITEYQNGAAIWFEAGLNRDEVHKAFSIWQDDPARISYGDPARVDSCTYEETGKPTFYTLTCGVPGSQRGASAESSRGEVVSHHTADENQPPQDKSHGRKRHTNLPPRHSNPRKDLMATQERSH